MAMNDAEVQTDVVAVESKSTVEDGQSISSDDALLLSMGKVTSLSSPCIYESESLTRWKT